MTDDTTPAEAIARAEAITTAALAEVDQLKAAARDRAREFGIQLRDGLDYEGVWFPVEDGG